MKPTAFFWVAYTLFFTPNLWAEDLPNTTFTSSASENRWVPPPPVDENDRIVKFLIQTEFQHDADVQDQAFGVLDLSLKRPLDETSISAEGLVRFRKDLSTSDTASSVDLRLARISYLESWLQITAGRFDLFHSLSPNLFFGAYPIMGIHRVDGIMATVPFSFFFDFGPAKESKSENSSPLALSFFYTPSLFSAQEVQYNLSQSFWISQLRFRIDTKDFASTFRANFGSSASDYFDYSSINGNSTGSLAVDLSYQQNYDLTAEYGIQNIDRPSETGVLALGLQASRLGTWGGFSFDQIAIEGQIPAGTSLNNPFTGGNGFMPYLAQLPKPVWYIKLRARLKVLFFELHVTNNQNDYTLARFTPGSLGLPFTGSFGPGNETDGPGTTLRSNNYNNAAFLLRTGVEF